MLPMRKEQQRTKAVRTQLGREMTGMIALVAAAAAAGAVTAAVVITLAVAVAVAGVRVKYE